MDKDLDPANIISTDPRAREFYRSCMHLMAENEIPFLVGGAWAAAWYTKMERRTKDLDVFVCFGDLDRIFQVFDNAGFETMKKYPTWLAKVYDPTHQFFMDVIWDSANGVTPVDSHWFEHAPEGTVIGLPCKICPLEEMIWSKAFIMERERFDGADVAHLLNVCCHRINWRRLLDRFKYRDFFRVLLSHLVLFGFIYPDDKEKIPSFVLSELLSMLSTDQPGLTISDSDSASALPITSAPTVTISDQEFREININIQEKGKFVIERLDASLFSSNESTELEATRERRLSVGGVESPRVCQGTLLSPFQYKLDIERSGYVDGRLAPIGKMNEREIAHLTNQMEAEKAEHRKKNKEIY